MTNSRGEQVFVEREPYERNGRRYFSYFVSGTIRGKDVRVAVTPPDKGGYAVLKIEKERGTMDGKIEKKRYYIMSKKIYSRRFSTDCFSDYFDDMARHAPVGLDGYLEYATEKASVEELKSQHSYFIDSLYRDGDDGQGGRSV